MKITVTKNGIKNSSLLKVLILGFGLGITPIMLFIGATASFGYSSFSLQGHELTGWSAIIGSILSIPFISITWALTIWLHTIFGLWLYKKFKKIEVISEID